MHTATKDPAMQKLDRRPPAPSPDKLDRVNAALREVRDLELENQDLEASLKRNNERLLELQHSVLPDLFAEANLRQLTLEGEGNLPPFRAQLRPFYKAGIPADWEDKRREEAFTALKEAGGEDLIKTVIQVELDPGDRKTAERIEAGLRRMGVEFKRQLSVHWKTLTAFVQEQYEAHPPRALPLEKLGAVIGQRVTIKPEARAWQKK